MNALRWKLSAGLAALLAAVPGAPAQQPQFTPPHLGYLYPAGGRQGATVEVTAGGQFLRAVTSVHVWGNGLQVTVGKYAKPLNAEEYFRLQEKLKGLRERFQAERAMVPPGRARAVYQRLLRELGVTEDDVEAVRKFVAERTDPKRQFNFQIAETVVLQIKIDPKATPGEREMRLITPAGLSNPLRFHVGRLPECRKSGSDAVSETEVREPLPIVLNGQILPGGADRFAFPAHKGSRLVAVASARDLIPYLADAVPGWFQASLTLYDAEGNEVAYAEDYRFQPDPVLYYEVPVDGRYVLEIKDAMYRGRQDFVYRVTLGEVPFVTDVFPLGARRGAGATVELMGWNLPLETLTLDASHKEPGIHPLSVLDAEQIVNRVPFACDALPECFDQEENDGPDKAQQVDPPVIVNGRIDRPGDWDVFRFEGRAGSDVVAEVYARRLGSPMDSLLRLTDDAGQLLMVNDDHEDKAAALLTHQADSRLSLSLPATGTYYLHLGDTQRKGGTEYAYRLRIGPPRPDFELRVVPSSINARAGTNVPITVYALRRDGFDGDITLELKDAPYGFALDAGVLPADQDNVRLTLAVPPTGGGEPISLSLQGRALIGGRKVERAAVPAEDMIQAFAYHHLVPARQWLISVHNRRWANVWWKLASEDRVTLRAGSKATVRFLVPRGAMLGQAQLTLNDPPEGIAIESRSPVRNGVNVVLRADPAKAKSGLVGNLILDASMERHVGAAQGKPPGTKQRIPIGSLPAIPFQIVGP
ncbi:MAG TPA: peptidase [Thermoguttaceae bacterium]|nr:peptidase [Thermoguttaceae bacterium]